MRAFLAIEFPATLKRTYADALTEFEPRLPGLRWVRPDCLHLTMRFLGDIEDRVASRLEAPTAALAREAAPSRLSLGEPGVFGSSAAPRVFWFAVDEGREMLAGLQARLETLVREAGHAPERKAWNAHVTVARCRDGARSRGDRGTSSATAWRDMAAASDLSGAGFFVTDLTLMSSRLTPQGPDYDPVWRVKLGD